MNFTYVSWALAGVVLIPIVASLAWRAFRAWRCERAKDRISSEWERRGDYL